MTKLAASAILCFAGRMVPIWISPNQGSLLNPPAEVLKLGDTRSADNLRAAALALRFTEAKRYQPSTIEGVGHVTWCNIATADFCQIVKAPLPHVFDLQDGKGKREMRANDIYDGLTANKFPGWTKTGTIASALAVRNLAQCGVPQVAVWRNANGKPGHITPVIPSPDGDSRVWVAGAGAHCSNGCPIEQQFGSLPVTFFAFNG